MFREVDYAGLDDRPGARALAERGTELLSAEIGPEWRPQVAVVWEAAGAPAALQTTVTLTLPIGSGAASVAVPQSEFDDEGLVRFRLRGAWDRALGALLEGRKAVWNEFLHQPAEA